MPEVVDAEYEDGFRIHLVFNDGTEGTVDFARWVGRGPVFEPLQDREYFRRFFVDAETVTWPNGADIAPETLYDAARATHPDRLVNKGRAKR